MDDDYSPEDAVRLFSVDRLRTDSPLKINTSLRTVPSLKVDPDRVYAIMNLDQLKLPKISVDGASNGTVENVFFNHHHHRNDHHADFNPAKIFQLDRNSSDFFFPKEKCWYVFDPDTDQYLVPTLLIFFGLVSLIGSAFVFISFVSSRRLRTGQNLMLLNISFSDIVYVISLVPVTLLNYSANSSSPPFPIQPTTCRAAYYVISVTVYVTMYTLVAACLFRFLGLLCRSRDVGDYTKKGSSRSLTMCNAGIFCLVIWITFILSHVKLLIQSPAHEYDHVGTAYSRRKHVLCHVDDIISSKDGENKTGSAFSGIKALWITFLTCAFLVPLLVVCFFAGSVLRRGHRSVTSSPDSLSQRGLSRPPSHIHHYETVQNLENDSRRRREMALVVMVSALIRCLCWIPLLTVTFMATFGATSSDEGLVGRSSSSGGSGGCPGESGAAMRKAELFGVCLTILATCSPAFIYCGLVEDFKQWAWSCMGGRRSKHPHNRVNIGAVLGNNASLTLNGVKMVEMNETIMSIITDSSNHINYAG